MKMLAKLCCTCSLLFTLMFALPGMLWAQKNETVVEFFSDHTVLEDDPNQGVYNITIFSPDMQWKIQLNYHSDSMFGTFTNADFRLDSTGKYYNYARNPNNDMVFYSFTDMVVSVTDEGTLYRVNANCLTNNNTRFLVEAVIDAPQPETTVSDSLGYARVVPNAFYGTYVIKAENENYKLEYGIVSDHLLGTFYRADLLKPELYDKKAQKAIEVLAATAYHTQSEDSTLMRIELLSDDHVLYNLSMFNAPHDVVVTEERDIAILSGVVLQDLSAMYGCYQFGGQNDEYAVAIAITPEAIQSGRTEWTSDDIFLPYTAIIKLDGSEQIDIFDANATFNREDNIWVLRANVTSMDGILYHVSMHLREGGSQPQVSDTVSIDFGDLAVLDYSKGIGTVGFGAFKQGKYQMRFYLNTFDLEGSFSNEDFVLDLCDVMVVDEDRGTYVFHDAKYMEATMTKDEEATRITVDMYGVDNVLYHATMQLQPMQCLQDMNMTVGVDDGILMLALQEGSDGESSEYNMQLQDMESVYDDDYNVVGDGYALSFYFAHEGNASVAGEYGYSAGTLAEDEIHTFFEKGCEIRIAPVAGTLTLEALNPVTVSFDTDIINTYLYKVKAQFLGQNGAVYNAEGENFLLCLDQEGEFLDMNENLTHLTQALAEQGIRIRKVLKDGKFIVERDGKSYSLDGSQNK